MKLPTIVNALFVTAVLAHPAPAKDDGANTEIYNPPGGSETYYGVRSIQLPGREFSQLTHKVRNAAATTGDVSSWERITSARPAEYACPEVIAFFRRTQNGLLTHFL